MTFDNSWPDPERTDLATTIVDLQLRDIAYTSVLAATARIIQPSLLDFLR